MRDACVAKQRSIIATICKHFLQDMAAVDYTGFRWHRSDRFYNPYAGKGAVLFNGPDGIRDHKTKILDPCVIGSGTISPEGTSELDYIWRAAKDCPHPRPKSVKVGEIGWDVSSVREDQVKMWKSGHQIKLKEFRLACELRHTHLYQNPWYPAPKRANEQLTILSLRKLKDSVKYNGQATCRRYKTVGSWTSSGTSATRPPRQKQITLAF